MRILKIYLRINLKIPKVLFSFLLIGNCCFSQLTATVSGWNDISCNTACDGTMTVSASSGTTPYTYLWNDQYATTTATATGLCPMAYQVIVSDAIGDTVIVSDTLQTVTGSQIDSVSIVPASDSISCDGSIQVYTSGVQSVTNYWWSDSSTANPITNICTGTYAVTMLDAAGCLFSWSGFLPFNPISCNLSIDSLLTSDLTCNGNNDGVATVFATGTAPPLTYLWTDSIGDTIGSNSTTIFSLPAGSYTVSVFDTSGCITASLFTIYEPTLLTSTITDTNDVSCFGNCDGSATAEGAGGTPPYIYVWNDGQLTATADSLCPGMYSVVVIDSIGCLTMSNVIIGEPAPSTITLSITDTGNPLCNGDATGFITVTAYCGSQPYTYLWNDPLSQTSATATGFNSGTYQVVVTDFNGLVDSAVVTITEPSSIFDSSATTICSNDSILLEGTYQNTAGIYFDTLLSANSCDSVIVTTLMVNPTPVTNTPDITICTNQAALIFGVFQTTAGMYYDSLTTVNDCDSIIATLLIVLDTPIIDLGSDTSICNGCSITLDAGVGFTNYLWSTGAGSQTITIDSAGIYSVEITDTNGCINTDTIVIDIASGIHQSARYIDQPLIIYPNPNTGQFNLAIDLREKTSLSIKLYHSARQLIYSEEISNVTGNYTQQIDLSRYTRGIYYLQIMTKEGVVMRKVVYQ